LPAERKNITYAAMLARRIEAGLNEPCVDPRRLAGGASLGHRESRERMIVVSIAASRGDPEPTREMFSELLTAMVTHPSLMTAHPMEVRVGILSANE
jgi:hypothetical protein